MVVAQNDFIMSFYTCSNEFISSEKAKDVQSRPSGIDVKARVGKTEKPAVNLSVEQTTENNEFEEELEEGN
jgi:hypothetical protein